MTTLKNFVRVTLYADITDSATEIRFDPAVAPFNTPPNPAGRLAYAVLIDNLSAPTVFEIVTYTKMEFNRLRGVTRAVGGTTAQAWTEGALIVQDIPAALVEPLGLEGSAGDALRVGPDGNLAVGAISWNELAGVLSERGVLVMSIVGSNPATPPSGEVVLFAKEFGGNDTIFVAFSSGVTKSVANDT